MLQMVFGAKMHKCGQEKKNKKQKGNLNSPYLDNGFPGGPRTIYEDS